MSDTIEGASEATLAASYTLPQEPNLEHLKNQARSFQRALVAGDTDAMARFRARHPHPNPSLAPSLASAQLVLAREYGFESWPKLRAHVMAVSLEAAVAEFKKLINSGNADGVRRFLKSHPEVRKRIDSPWFDFESPALVHASSAKNRDVIGVLLDAGADINLKSSWGPGGFGALDNADEETAAFLLARGAKLGIHAAAKHGRLDRVREVVEADPAAANERGGDGMTPLHFASTVEICEYLLDHGADINCRDIDHCSTPAQYAIRNPEKLRYLVSRGAEADIFIACRLGDWELASKLLQRDRDALRWRLNHTNYGVEAGHIYMYMVSIAVRPITLAADHAGPEFKEHVLKNTHPIDNLLIACAYADLDAVDQIVEKHPNVVSTLTADDAAFISDAAWENRIEAIRTMIHAGFDIDAVGMDHGTALERASLRGWAPIVRLLIEAGASLDIANDYGGAPLGAAIWGSLNWPRETGNHPECVEALIEAGSKLPDHLNGSPEVQQVLKKYGVSRSV